MLDLTFSCCSKVLFKSLAEIVLCLATLRQFLLICALHVAAAEGVGSGCAEGDLSAEHCDLTAEHCDLSAEHCDLSAENCDLSEEHCNLSAEHF